MGTPKQGSSKKIARSARNKAKKAKKVAIPHGEVQTAQPKKVGSTQTGSHSSKTR